MKTLSYIMYTIWWCIGAYLGMHYALFIFLMSFMLFDTITGIAKWVRLKSFNSSRLTRWLISKIFILNLIILLWAWSNVTFENIIIDNYILGAIIGMLCIAEIISSIQNIIVVHTGEAIKEYDAVSMVLHTILWFFRDRLENMKNIK